MSPVALIWLTVGPFFTKMAFHLPIRCTMDQLLAAVDLGSNSFRLSIARIVQNDNSVQIYATDRLKETVRLAAGLNADRVLDEDAIQRAIAVLSRFGERLENFPAGRVRAVATNTFRVARNVADFLPRAEAALGYPIEVISGQEEARLVYSGVVHELPPSSKQRFVVDIGGGSTEFIIGRELEPLIMKSLAMGCVTYTKSFFPDGKVTEEGFVLAEIAARKEIEIISRQYRHLGWDEAFGSSGTAKALVATLEESGFSEKGITLDGMQKLKKVLIRHGSAHAPELRGLKLDRMEVLPAGLSIMMAIFSELQVKQMFQGDGALRVGVLYDMLGRDSSHDKRDETAGVFMKRYHIDSRQAARVKKQALAFFDSILADETAADDLRRYLSWACDLHETGLSISQNNYHKHTAYVMANADMPGFSEAEQELLSFLTLGHQGKLDKLLPEKPSRVKWLLTLCLRLAVVFMRRRQPMTSLPVSLETDDQKLMLRVGRKWLEDHPLTRYTLTLEAAEWKKAGFTLDIIPS